MKKLLIILLLISASANANEKNLIIVNSSASGERSTSKYLTKIIHEKIKSKYKAKTIEYDLAKKPFPHIDTKALNEFNTNKGLSYRLANEVKNADIIIIGAPMWNFGIPSSLKAWIDHIVRSGVTFDYKDGKFSGLSKAKIFIVSTRGGKYKGSEMDYQENYLKTVFNFIGCKDIHIIRADGLMYGADTKAAAITDAEKAINELAL